MNHTIRRHDHLDVLVDQDAHRLTDTSWPAQRTEGHRTARSLGLTLLAGASVIAIGLLFAVVLFAAVNR